ncbi:P-loop containing nucleoside triphosphate hydrolase protein [Ochromonadaceae sp. CCMP2298]|nr:P-loop containing nucleoside triphosphate hydrolase protein [Ochromonadaceae sp. CCMP2298]
MLLGIKASSEANSAEQKRLAERKRNILVLVNHHLVENGYVEAAERLQHESGGVLGKFAAADNIDLGLVLAEYEAYYEMRFDKKPKLARKLNDGEEAPGRAGSKPGARRAVTSKESKEREKKEESGSGKLPSVTGASTGSTEDFGVSGAGLGISAAEKAKRSIAEEGERENNRVAERQERLLKPPPQFGGDGELRQLANVICKEIYQDSPNVRFTDIVGLDEAKRLLVEAVQLPLRFPYLFTGILRPWRGILLHGPPGTGKTLLAKAVATECSTTFFNISASTLVSKWRGDSEKLVRVLFEVARYHGPSTIFLDEIDSILTSRDGEGGEHEASRRMKTELLIQMDGVKGATAASASAQVAQGGSSSEQVFVMAASNLPWDLDIAVLRRLEKRVLVPLPSAGAREAMFRKHLGDRSVGLDFTSVAERTGGYSGADIELVSRESAMMPVRRLMGRIDGLDMGQASIGGVGNKGMIPDPPPSGPTGPTGPSSSSSSYAASRARKSASAAASSMADIEALLKQDPVTLEDVGSALGTTKPSSDGKIAKYEAWQNEFGSV